MKTWIITDTHFNHDAMVELAGRPKNHTQLIISNWRKQVDSNDLVIHLGDVIFSRAGELAEIMDCLPGRKVLTLGNHDKRPPAWYMRRGFDFACKMFVHKGIAFSHTPLNWVTLRSLSKDFGEDITLNIHGHFHNSDHRTWEYEVDDHNLLLAIESTNYRPVMLDTFLASKMLI